jgi:hypothetical protein
MAVRQYQFGSGHAANYNIVAMRVFPFFVNIPVFALVADSTIYHQLGVFLREGPAG